MWLCLCTATGCQSLILFILSGDLFFIDAERLHLLHSFKAKFNQPLLPAVTVSTALTLHHHCITNVSTLRHHCIHTASPLHITTASTLHPHWVTTASPLHNHYVHSVSPRYPHCILGLHYHSIHIESPLYHHCITTVSTMHVHSLTIQSSLFYKMFKKIQGSKLCSFRSRTNLRFTN